MYIDIFCIFTDHNISELYMYSSQEVIEEIIPTSNLLLWVEDRPRPRVDSVAAEHHLEEEQISTAAV